ncbi:MAG: (2Fe-2S)-binding protein [Deltaproteobacteria bacterium]|nr:(2Fe-2S)-binding protein [Deltaproteobacteria bacterium]
MSTTKICFKLNGQSVQVSIAPNTLLIDLLRDNLGLTGTKAGCREGVCGACTVLLDGIPINSCLLPALKVADRSVTTIEGLAGEDGQLHPLQQAFMLEGAAQCGFCTPGMVINAKALLDKNSKPDESEIRHSLSGVLCRCTGYHKIVQAVKTASGIMGSEE